LKKFYYYFYYTVYKLSIKISDDALNEIKPGAMIIALEVMLYAQILIWLEILKMASGKIIDILWSKPILVAVVLISVIFNYYVFIHHNKWKKYNKEFSTFDRKKKKFLAIMMLLVIIIILGGLVLSFIRLANEKG
jgi:hypothetical protein